MVQHKHAPRAFGLRLKTLRKFVQNIGRLVNGAALLTRGWEDMSECLPEAESPVTDGQFRSLFKAPRLQIQQDFFPGEFALADAIDNRN